MEVWWSIMEPRFDRMIFHCLAGLHASFQTSSFSSSTPERPCRPASIWECLADEANCQQSPGSTLSLFSTRGLVPYCVPGALKWNNTYDRTYHSRLVSSFSIQATPLHNKLTWNDFITRLLGGICYLEEMACNPHNHDYVPRFLNHGNRLHCMPPLPKFERSSDRASVIGRARRTCLGGVFPHQPAEPMNHGCAARANCGLPLSLLLE